MNILHLNQSDRAGGAAIAAYRLHQGLLSQGVQSRLLVGTRKTSSDRVSVVPRQLKLENQLSRLNRLFSLNYINLVSSFDVPQHHLVKEADILNLHNLHTGYFNYLALPKLTSGKPTVWTLHDMWSFTGHCSYSYDCERWKMGCGKCPYPNIYPEIKRDNTHLEWRLKDWAYNHSRLSLVALSHWMQVQLEQSLFKTFPVYFIPNGLNTSAYQPLVAEQCRVILGIEPKSRVLMFVAEQLTDTRKGGDLLLKALAHLPTSLKAEIVLLTLGNGGEALIKGAAMKCLHLGFVESDRLKSIAYSAADLFLFPTRADNLPLVLQESMACGTPMVSFNVGGVPELVRPGVTGYLAKPEDTADFARGIVELCEDDSLRDRLSQNCRAIAIAEYSLELQVRRYHQLYQQLLS